MAFSRKGISRAVCAACNARSIQTNNASSDQGRASLTGTEKSKSIVALGKQFFEPAGVGQGKHRAASAEHGERHHGGARPLREIVNAEREPAGKADDLGRKVGNVPPRPDTDQREPIAREDAHVGEAAMRVNPGVRPRQFGAPGRLAHRAQRRIDLDRGVDVAGGRARIDVPGAVLPLAAQQGAHDTRPDRQFDAEDMRTQQPLRFDAGIGFDHADPIALGFLRAQEPGRGAIEGLLEVGAQGRSSVCGRGSSRRSSGRPTMASP